MSTEQVFNKKLDILELNLSLEFKGDTFSERLISLHEITRDPFYSHKVVAYAGFMKNMIVSDARKVETQNFGTDVKPFVIDWLFISLLHGMAHIYPLNNHPKVHHWLPVTYLKPFGIKGNGKTRAMVDGVAFMKNNTVDVAVKDVQFAHNRGKGYDLALESFFFQIEDSYSNYRENTDYSMFPIVVSAFFIAQSVRSPHPESGFVGRDIKRVVDALIKNIEDMDEMYGIHANVKYRLPISPYTPVRVRKLSDGNRVFVLPIMPSKSFVLSDKPLTADKARGATENYRINVILEAKREKGMVFGISSRSLQAILDEAGKG